MSYKLNDNIEVYTTEEADERFSAGNVQVEKERAEAAEAALGTRIDNEITRATAAEGTNASNIAQNTSDIASLSSTVSGFSTDISANTSAITAEVARATTAEGQLSTDLITESARATNAEQANAAIIEVNRAKQIFVFELEADKPDVNYDATTKIKISDGQLIFVKDTKKWYTATTTSTGGDPVTWTEFQMPGGSVNIQFVKETRYANIGENGTSEIEPDTGYVAFEKAQIEVGIRMYKWAITPYGSPSGLDYVWLPFGVAPDTKQEFDITWALYLITSNSLPSIAKAPNSDLQELYNLFGMSTSDTYVKVDDNTFQIQDATTPSDYVEVTLDEPSVGEPEYILI